LPAAITYSKESLAPERSINRGPHVPTIRFESISDKEYYVARIQKPFNSLLNDPDELAGLPCRPSAVNQVECYNPLMQLAMLWAPGAPEIIFICVAAVILFGASKVPQFMKGLGQGVKEFKDAIKDDPEPPAPINPVEPAASKDEADLNKSA
jgi:sec-independent protein translocase protein TatA